MVVALGAVSAIGGPEGCAAGPEESVREAAQAVDEAQAVAADPGDTVVSKDIGIDPIGIDPIGIDPIGIDPILCTDAPACDGTITANVDPSLVVPRPTHAALLDTHFQLADVLQQLITLSGAAGETPTELLRRLWDTENDAGSAAFNDGFQPHCAGSLNNYPLECNRGEGGLAFSVEPTDFIPVALFNRFDLAPADGSHCGEYRIVYSSTAVTGALIFEGQLPNPNPACGLEACRPVAEFWQSLSSVSNPATLGKLLREFYFGGLPGFSPVIQPENYGFSAGKGVYGASGGQIRSNTITTSWQLREFHLALGDAASGATLFAEPVTVKNNPFGELFEFGSSRPEAPSFQSFFPDSSSGTSEVQTLVATNVNRVSMATPDNFNAGQSTVSFDVINDYQTALDAGGPGNPFMNAIGAELQRIFCAPGTVCTPPLTAQNVADRATSQSCAGCHQLSNGVNMGNGMTWPSSNGFLHVGFSGNLSPALRCVFLPHRQSVLLTFLRNCPTTKVPVVTPLGCGSSGGGKGGGIPVEPVLESTEPETLGGGSKVN
ncbi:MAG: hypothetical protein QM820_40690 [Minicystis sp.]